MLPQLGELTPWLAVRVETVTLPFHEGVFVDSPQSEISMGVEAVGVTREVTRTKTHMETHM